MFGLLTRLPYLLEVVELLLQHLNLLQVRSHLLAGQGSFLLVDPLLQFVCFPEQHELLATLLQHAFALLTQLQQRAVSGVIQEGDKRGREGS